MTDETRALRWALEVAPRLGVAGFVVGSVTLDRMVTQVADTSQGRLPAATAAARAGVYRATIAKQAAISGAQYLATREIKLALDAVQPSAALSVVVACGLAGVPFSSLQYNSIIVDVWRYHGHAPPGGVTGGAPGARARVS